MRRKDRAVEDGLDSGDASRFPLARWRRFTTEPYINTNLFAFDEAARMIYMHTANAGRTRQRRSGRARLFQ
jgi:hypothetical protein